MNEYLMRFTWIWVGVIAIANILMLAGSLGGAQWYLYLDEVSLSFPIFNMAYIFFEVALLVPLIIAVRLTEGLDEHADREKASRWYRDAQPGKQS